MIRSPGFPLGLAVAWLALLAVGLAAEDQIVLQNGSVFTGRIVAEESEWITIVTATGTFRFRRAEIAKLERTAAPARENPGGRGPGRATTPARPPGTRNVVVAAARDEYGRLDQLRLDRHPSYDSLLRSGPGAWALFSTPEGRPHHSEERWIVETVSETRLTVLKERLDYGAVVGWSREIVDRRDFGPAMPAAILRTSTLGKKEVSTPLGRFATLCVRTEEGAGEIRTRYYCPEVAILGLVEEYHRDRLVRRLTGFGWKGRRPQTEGVAAGAAPPAAGEGETDKNPVEAAYRRARPGDFAVWRDPDTGRQWREVVFRVTPAEVVVQTQAWIDGEFRSHGTRRFDLARPDRDYLDRAGAAAAGREILQLAGRRLACCRWRSASGHVVFWTNPDVKLGGLVRQTLGGRVVCELVQVGSDAGLIEGE